MRLSIRAKLLGEIIGIVLLFVAAGAVYFALLAPTERMGRERASFAQLSEALLAQQVALNRLESIRLPAAVESFAAAVEGSRGAFGAVSKAKALPAASADIAKAIGVIVDLETLNAKRLDKLEADLASVKADAEAIYTFIDNMSVGQMLSAPPRPGKAEVQAAARTHIAALSTDVSILNDSLEAARASISEQFAVIDREIAAARSRALAIAGGIALLILALALAGSLAIASGIAGSVEAIERNVALLKERDLAGRARVGTQDEIGRLAQNLNSFLDGLSASLAEIQRISSENLSAKDMLIRAAEDTGSSASRIESSERLIGEKIGNLAGRVESSAGSLEKIGASLDDLNAQAEGQGAMVDETTASVTQTLASIDGIREMADRCRASAEALVAESSRGRTIFGEAFDRVSAILARTSTIEEMAGVIQGIAAQTNLLAMNAAIEAAHAGEAGRGFSVVAEEIRKLSEAAARSSKDISGSIRGIIAEIDEAMASNAETTSAFSSIDEGIKAVSGAMAEVHARIDEVRTGSERVLEAASGLKERSHIVREGARAIDAGSAELRSTMSEARDIAREVSSAVAEIAAGIEDIGRATRRFGLLADQVGGGSARLDAELSRFKLEPKGEPTSASDEAPISASAPAERA